MAGIDLALGFSPGFGSALDDRFGPYADITARNALSAVKRYLGMIVHVIDSDGAGTPMNYQLIDGLLDANWTEFAGGGSGSGGMEDSTAVGPSETLLLPTLKFVRLIGDGVDPLEAVEGIVAGEHGQEVVLINYLGVYVTLKDQTGTMTERLFHGYSIADIELTPYSSAHYVYDSEIEMWILVGLLNFVPTEIVVNQITADYTVLPTDDVILVDATAGNVIISLPTAVGWTKLVRIKKTDNTAYTVAIAPDGSETIDGESSRVIYDQYHSATLISDNANWSIF